MRELSIICSLILFGCTELTIPKDTYTEYYPNKEVKLKKSCLNDTCEVLYFTEEGNLYDSLTTYKDLIIGVRKTWEYDEKYFTLIQYENGLRNGFVSSYYFNGKVRLNGQCENNNQIGEWIYYHNNESISSYEYFDYHGEKSYIRLYDLEGNLINSKGEGISYLSFLSDTLKVGEEFICRVYIATPPNVYVKVFVAEELNSNDEPTDEFYEYEIVDGGFIYKTKFESKGIYKKGFAWLLNDSISGKEEKDFKVLNLYVN